jgi:hypothetical protein
MNLMFKKFNQNLNVKTALSLGFQTWVILVLEAETESQIQFLSYQKYYWTTFIHQNRSCIFIY